MWRVTLFDGPTLYGADGAELRRFRSQRVGALLAYLGAHLGRRCSREELYEAIWPEEDPAVVANRFRVTLTSLRKQMEPPGVPYGSVIDASASGIVRLRSETVWCDVPAFERAAAARDSALAARLANGVLLPGYYDEWVIELRTRLENLRDTLDQASRSPSPPTSVSESPSAGRPAGDDMLPFYLTNIIGREADDSAVLSLLAELPLVTLTGPGGIGKTRLAVETARRHSGRSVFVPLAELKEQDSLAEAVIRAHGQAAVPGVDALALAQIVINRSSTRLLVLDNAEQLIPQVAELALALLQAVPGLRLLVTSRERLDVSGEAVYPVKPLDFPKSNADASAVQNCSSVKLFVDRARRSRPDFTPSLRHSAAIAEICRRLDGMPLAIELAAAHVATQTPTQIARALSSSVIDLSSSLRGLSARHRSLRAAIQGSYDILSADLQAFFAAMAVFHGGWTAEAARAVTACDSAEEMLAELLAKSLVTAVEDEATGRMRFGALEALRQFALEAIEEFPLQGAELHRRVTPGSFAYRMSQRHAAYYADLAEACAARIESHGDLGALAELEREHHNVRASLQWCLDASQNGLAAAIARSMSAFWSIRGHFAEGSLWFERLRAGPAEPELAGDILLSCGRFALKQNRYAEAETYAEQALVCYRDQHNNAGVMRAAISLADVDRLTGNHARAVERYNSALALAVSARDEKVVASCHHGIGVSNIYTGDYKHAVENLERALSIRSGISHSLEVARTCNLLAFARFELGEDAAAQRLFERALPIMQEHGDRWYYASSLYGMAVIAYHNEDGEALERLLTDGIAHMNELGSRESEAGFIALQALVRLRAGQLDEAITSANESLQLARSFGSIQCLSYVLECCALVLLNADKPATAAVSCAFAGALRNRSGYRRNRYAQRVVEQVEAGLAQRFGPEEMRRHAGRTERMTDDEVYELISNELALAASQAGLP